jgi:uncharacterized membrane protein
MKVDAFTGSVDEAAVVAAIRGAEARSTGEVRVHVSSQSPEDVEAAAAVVFEKLGMTKTEARNGVLLFIAPKRQKFAIIGDSGIHMRCGPDFWKEIAGVISEDFRGGRFTDGIVKGVARAGDVLAKHFPRTGSRPDTNELSDDVSKD